MPLCYDIYGLSKNRDKQTIENFLNHFCHRDKIEDRQGQEIAVYTNKKYNIQEVWTPIKTMTDVIEYGLNNLNHGFAFYIGDHIKDEKEISYVILKFTYDGKIIFGVSVEENRNTIDGDLADNYDQALKLEKEITELTEAIKTSIQFEYAPSDDEQEFDKDIALWLKIRMEKQAK